jgi:hypothetical protein
MDRGRTVSHNVQVILSKEVKMLNKMTDEELRKMLRKMSPRSKLFKLIKEEMTKRGHWKALPRGKANVEHFKSKKA